MLKYLLMHFQMNESVRISIRMKTKSATNLQRSGDGMDIVGILQNALANLGDAQTNGPVGVAL